MNLDFNKNKDGLIPAIIQDSVTKNILMLGYMNQEAAFNTVVSNSTSTPWFLTLPTFIV